MNIVKLVPKRYYKNKIEKKLNLMHLEIKKNVNILT